MSRLLLALPDRAGHWQERKRQRNRMKKRERERERELGRYIGT